MSARSNGKEKASGAMENMTALKALIEGQNTLIERTAR